MLEVETIVVGDFLTCAYLVNVKGDVRAMVVDPGAEGDRLLEAIARRGLEVETILNTHGHVDHIEANQVVKEAFPEAQLVVSREDAPMLDSPMRNLSALFFRRVKSPAPDRLVAEGDTVSVGDTKGLVIATPGHTPGGISLYFSAEQNDGCPVVFSGDALFRMSIGRHDFPGGNGKELIRSIQEKLLTLPRETRVYPGHGEPTTIGEEADANPFVALPAR